MSEFIHKEPKGAEQVIIETVRDLLNLMETEQNSAYYVDLRGKLHCLTRLTDLLLIQSPKLSKVFPLK